MCNIRKLTQLRKWFPVYLKQIEDIDGLQGQYFEVPFSGECRLVVSDGRLSGKIGDLDVILHGNAKSNYGVVSAMNSRHGLDYIAAFLKNFAAIRSDVLVAVGQEDVCDFVDLLAI